jgi:Uncharacterized conserved protein (DUF2340)
MLTLTIRFIKSFQYRTTKNLIIQVEEGITVGELIGRAIEQSKTCSGFKPYANCVLDTAKLYVKAHGSKSQNLVINLQDDFFLDYEKSLEQEGIENETEISLFNLKDYLDYKNDLQDTKW